MLLQRLFREYDSCIKKDIHINFIHRNDYYQKINNSHQILYKHFKDQDFYFKNNFLHKDNTLLYCTLHEGKPLMLMRYTLDEIIDNIFIFKSYNNQIVKMKNMSYIMNIDNLYYVLDNYPFKPPKLYIRLKDNFSFRSKLFKNYCDIYSIPIDIFNEIFSHLTYTISYNQFINLHIDDIVKSDKKKYIKKDLEDLLIYKWSPIISFHDKHNFILESINEIRN